METLLLEGTENTPRVVLDDKKGQFEISGRSLPENASGFYRPVIQWLEGYAAQPNATTDFAFKLEYLNTGTSKMILDLLFALREIKGAHVSWYFLEDDEDMEETGEEFAELAGVPFELKAY